MRGIVAFDRIGSYFFYLLLAAISCLMAYQVQTSRPSVPVRVKGQYTRRGFRNRLFLAGIFFLLFMVSALRFGIGNDYGQYTQTAHEAYVGGYVVTEAGFNALVRVLYGISGGECYELVFAVFAFFTLLFFLKAFVRQSVSFPQTFFLFMTMGLYFQTFNTVRYYLALSVALFSMKYVLEGDGIKFVFWILVAALFHKSVLLVLPFYWIASFEWKRWHIITGVIASAACFAGRGAALKLALLLYPSYKNTIYLEGGGSMASILRILAALVLCAWFARYKGEGLKTGSRYRELRFYGQLNLLALAAGTFFSFLPVVTRIVYYFSVSQLFLIPLVIQGIDDRRVKKRVGMIVAAACAAYFAAFLLQAHRDGAGLLPYRSWLFTEERFVYH